MYTFVCKAYKCNNPPKFICGKCMIVRYCSEKCQKTDWYDKHSNECHLEASFLHNQVKASTKNQIGFNIEDIKERFWKKHGEVDSKFWENHDERTLAFLGAGSYAAVFSVTTNQSEEYAIKIYLGVNYFEDIAIETTILQYISEKCESSLKYYGASRIPFIDKLKKMLPEKARTALVYSQNVWMSKTELIRGENLEENYVFDPLTFVKIAIPLLQQLTCLHENGLLHNDIKPANVMLEKNTGDITRVVLIDYGLSCIAYDHKDTLDEYQYIRCDSDNKGITPIYTAPEVLKLRKAHQKQTGFMTKPSDVWSLGVTLLAMTIKKTHRYRGIPSIDPLGTIDYALNSWDWTSTAYADNVYISDEDFNYFSNMNDCAKIVLSMIEENPIDRATAKDALSEFEYLKQLIEGNKETMQALEKFKKLHREK